ncbi:MAG: hypothetical protein AABX45_00870 [Nanoarchaeota archaeon]
MALTAIQTIAFIFILFGLIKILVVIFNKKIWYNNIVKPIYSSQGISTFVFIVLALILLYYILKGFSLTQVFAVIALTSVLIVLGFLQHSKELIPVFAKLYNKKITSWRWVYIIFWVILMVLALFEIF